jgi:hypothetical protein
MVRQHWQHSSAEFCYRIYDELPYIDLFIKVCWLEKRSVLKLVLEPCAPLDHLFAQIPQAAYRKQAQDVEEPLHGWLLYGPLAILQDGAFAYDWNAQRLRLTLVRSNLYAYAADRVIDTLGPLHHTDQGEHQFRLRLCPAAGLSPEHLAGLFTEFNEPFRVLRQNA